MTSKFSEEQRKAAREKIILPVDVSTRDEATDLLRKFAPRVGMIKIGLETMTALGGPVIAGLVASYKGTTFYDGKFSDIPNTTAKSVKAVAQLPNVCFVNVHATSGPDSIRAAVESRQHLKVLVVTVLTSISAKDCKLMFEVSPQEVVPIFARMAVQCGAQGIICSPQELAVLNQYQEFNELIKVTPGIQPSYMTANDQKRVMTPYEAIKAGADYLVIGRAITNPPKDHEYIQGDPLKALEVVTEEIASAMYEHVPA